MSYLSELVWAKHPDIKKPVQVSRGDLQKKYRLGWRELKGVIDYGKKEDKEKSNKKRVVREDSPAGNQREKSNEYKRLIGDGVIREITSEHERR